VVLAAWQAAVVPMGENDGQRAGIERMKRTREGGGRRVAGIWAAFAAVLTAACELREVTLAEPEDVIIAEVVLRAGDSLQTALVYRTRGVDGAVGARVSNAVVEVTAEAGGLMRYRPAPVARCLTPDSNGTVPATAARVGSCYVAAAGDVIPVLPGARYSLRVLTTDGRELTGTTVVPGAFEVRTPATAACRLPPGGQLQMRWTESDGAWAYLVDARFAGLRNAFAPLGITVPQDPFTLTGLAIGRADTTIALPQGFGLFDRFDSDLTPALVALQSGIPGNVVVDVTLAAGDRNFINWVRGGNFNPSGLVRVPSIRGGGTGVFGALAVHRVRVETRTASQLPAC
jgi:hypothetical protein